MGIRPKNMNDRNWSPLNQFSFNGSVSAIKTHEGGNYEPSFKPQKYQRAILVIRNPYATLIAEYKRQRSKMTWNKEQVTSMNETWFHEESEFLWLHILSIFVLCQF